MGACHATVSVESVAAVAVRPETGPGTAGSMVGLGDGLGLVHPVPALDWMSVSCTPALDCQIVGVMPRPVYEPDTVRVVSTVPL